MASDEEAGYERQQEQAGHGFRIIKHGTTDRTRARVAEELCGLRRSEDERGGGDGAAAAVATATAGAMGSTSSGTMSTDVPV